MSAHTVFVEVISTYASVTNLEYLHGIITLFHHLTTLGQQNAQNYAAVLHSKTQGKYGERNHKMATLNKPTFNLLTS